MTKLTVTYDRLIDIISLCNSVPTLENKVQINDKLSWAIQRFGEKNKIVIDKYRSSENDLNREFALVDDKGAFILDEKKDVKFTKEGQTKLNAALDKLRKETCEIEPYVCKDTTRSSTLHVSLQKGLDGIVIDLDPKIKAFEAEEAAELAADVKAKEVTASATTDTTVDTGVTTVGDAGLIASDATAPTNELVAAN